MYLKRVREIFDFFLYNIFFRKLYFCYCYIKYANSQNLRRHFEPQSITIYTQGGKKYIIAATFGGLGNRLKCLVSTMRFAEKLNREVILFWPKDPECYCSFCDLFDNKISEISKEEMETLEHKRDKRYMKVCTWKLETLPDDEIPNNFSRICPSWAGKNIDFEYERIPLTVRESFLIYFNRLLPKQFLREEVESFSKNFDDNTIAVSIRSWKDHKSRRDMFSIENVFKIMDTLNNKNFFISCDSQDIFEKNLHRYKERVLYYPKRTRFGDRCSTEGIQDAFIDMMLFSKTKVLVGSLISSFVEVAWWIGGCKAKVIIIPPKTYFFKIALDHYSLFWKWYFPIT